MKTLLIITNLLLSLQLCGTVAVAQDTLIPPNRIDLSITVSILHGSQGRLKYIYDVYNKPSSQQNLWRFWIGMQNVPTIFGVTNVPNWYRGSVAKDKDTTWVMWAGDSAFTIAPGSRTDRFQFESADPPSIVMYYAEGWTPIPDVDEGQLDTLGRIPGYNDLTPYGGGIVGKTVGPVPIPVTLQANDFLDTLISYKHQCVTLGWLTNGPEHEKDEDDDKADEGIVERLDHKLDEAKAALVKTDSVKAKQELELFAKEVEQLYHKNKEEGKRRGVPALTSEGYALLKYNAEYLIDKLPERHGKGDQRDKK
jgi:hypothetical protein